MEKKYIWYNVVDILPNDGDEDILIEAKDGWYMLCYFGGGRFLDDECAEIGNAKIKRWCYLKDLLALVE